MSPGWKGSNRRPAEMFVQMGMLAAAPDSARICPSPENSRQGKPGFRNK
jgi:hypothetical protein